MGQLIMAQKDLFQEDLHFNQGFFKTGEKSGLCSNLCNYIP